MTEKVTSGVLHLLAVVIRETCTPSSVLLQKDGGRFKKKEIAAKEQDHTA